MRRIDHAQWRALLTGAWSRLRRHRPTLVATLAGTVAVALAGAAVAVTRPGADARGPVAAAAASPGPGAGVDLPLPPKPDLSEFRKAARKPAATAPIRKLPKVHLEAVSVMGIPAVVLRAYKQATRQLAATRPGCRLPWWLLGGIGLVESGHASSGGSHRDGWNGVARPPIYGPVLDGSHGFLAVHDTDRGTYDGDRRWDRAVGPMQFLPSTWGTWGPRTADGERADPQDIRAAALAAAGYLCAGGSDLSQPHAMALAVYSYNHSFDYVRLVLSVAARYAGMTPEQLGVDLLPRDHHKKQHATKRKRHRTAKSSAEAAGADGGTRPTASPAASAEPTPTASPSPSPSPARAPVLDPSPTPLPTLSAPVLGSGVG